MNSLVYDCMFLLVEARRTWKNCRWVGLSISPASAGFRARSDLGRSLCNYTSLRGIYSSLREYNKLRPYYTAKEPATNWINTIGLRPRESFTPWYQIQIESAVVGNGRLLRKHTNSPDEKMKALIPAVSRERWPTRRVRSHRYVTLTVIVLRI